MWTTILTGLVVALGAGLVLFALNWLREHLTAKWRRQTEAEVLAFSLATELDRLISECSDVINDPRMEDPQTGMTEATVGIPSIAFGDNLPWSAFPKRLHYRIRALPNKIDAAVRSCASEAEYGDGPPDYSDYFREREIRFAWIGLEASALRFELTKTYGVDYLDRGNWNPEDDFKATIAKVEKHKAMLANLPEPSFMRRRVPIEDLEKRRADLGAAIEVATSKLKAK